MCYLFTEKIEAELRTTKHPNHDFSTGKTAAFVVANHIDTSAISHKRSADSILEHANTKAARHSENGPITIKEDRCETVGQTQTSEEKITSLEKTLAASEARQVKFEKLNEELKEKITGLQYEVSELEIKEQRQKDTTKAEITEMRNVGKQTLVKAKETISTELLSKLKDIKAGHEEKIKIERQKSKDKIEALKEAHEDELETKEQAWKKKSDELKAKNQQLEKDMKEMKAEHLKIQREIKHEQQEQIKQWKPEHSKACKEKDAVLKEKDKAIDDLSSSRNTSKEKMKQLQAEYKKLKQEMREKDEDSVRKVEIIDILDKASKQLSHEKAEISASFEAKLAQEGERCRVVSNKAEKLGQDLIQQQRANSVLRNGLDKANERVEVLEVQLSAGRQKVENPQESKTPANEAFRDIEEKASIIENPSSAHQAPNEHAGSEICDATLSHEAARIEKTAGESTLHETTEF